MPTFHGNPWFSVQFSNDFDQKMSHGIMENHLIFMIGIRPHTFYSCLQLVFSREMNEDTVHVLARRSISLSPRDEIIITGVRVNASRAHGR